MVSIPNSHSITPHGWHWPGHPQPTMEIHEGAKFDVEKTEYAKLPLVCARPHEAHSFGVFYGLNPLKFEFNLIAAGFVLVIFVTRMVRFLLKPLKEPRFISELIGGIIVGPSVLGQIKGFSNAIFPQTASFVIRNVGVMGFMLFMFVSGVKMDVGLIKKSGRKQLYMALISVLLPLVTVSIIAVVFRKSMDKELARVSSMGTIAASLSITAFPIHYAVLEEFNLLSSEVGNLALSIAIVSDAIGMNFVVIFEALKQGDVSYMNSVYYLISVGILACFMLTAVRRAMKWIVDHTPPGEAVDQFYVVTIFLGVFVMGFLTDMLGIAIANGSFWLGLVIPNGPPLGATLVRKSETIIMDIIMPFSFAFIGLHTDFNAMIYAGWPLLRPLFVMVVSGFIAKFLSTLIAAFVYRVPLKDSFALSLVLSMRGQVELILYVHYVDKNILKIPGFSMMVFLTALLTGTVTPMIRIFYDPTKPYMVNRRSTIQHNPPDTELGILLCIQDKTSVPCLINFLQLSYPTPSNPFTLHAFHLVELLGRANPLFIDHQQADQGDAPFKVPDDETIHHALKLYQESRQECIELNLYTCSTAKRSMYQDVCKLALISKVVIIIIPLHKPEIVGDMEQTEHWGSSFNTHVLAHAPCSVGVLVHKGNQHRWHLPFNNASQTTVHNLIVLFLGGADGREALAYADRVAKNPSVSITVIRFLSLNGEGDNEREKKLDDGVVTWFYVKNETNERLIYREIVVSNGAETAEAIQAVTEENFYHVWIVGRGQGINPKLLEGLSNWSENHDEQELGVIGEYLSSTDFVAADTVLVVQQQILREHGSAIRSRTSKFLSAIFLGSATYTMFPCIHTRSSSIEF